MELLAPAGGMEALRAALNAGADAVYLGLNHLNARRGAENFTPATLPEAVRLAHTGNAKVYLTLNILLSPREVGEAARALELARSCGVDAVLVADPAFLRLKAHYPELSFHFSTQAGIGNSAGMEAARELGLRRVVLARELSLAEIAAAARATPEVEAEVFAQGALCLCVSGRCLLSSWGGGRSGNRGACTSPCRVKWNVDGRDAGTPLSLRDLSVLELLPELTAAGVKCLKIEGRLKNAAWVGKAVGLYRAALDWLKAKAAGAAGRVDGEWKERVNGLGDYSGRAMTAGYLRGERHQLTGESARPAFAPADSAARGGDGLPAPAAMTENRSDASGAAPAHAAISALPEDYAFSITLADGRFVCVLTAGRFTERWEMTAPVVKHRDRALTLTQAGDWLAGIELQRMKLREFSTDTPGELITRRAVNDLSDRLSSILHRWRKQAKQAAACSAPGGADGAAPAAASESKGGKKHIDIALPEVVRAMVAPGGPCAGNDRRLGHKPNVVRIEAARAENFLAAHAPERLIVEDATAAELERLCALCRNSRLTVALPAVFYEEQLAAVRELVARCVQLQLEVEVNGWDSWRVASQAEARFHAGPGLLVLNPLAAQSLTDIGACSVTFSPEASRQQLEELSERCRAEGTLLMYGRTILVYTRAGLALRSGAELTDARGIRLKLEQTQSVTRLRAVEPFNWSGLQNERIRARWLCADLCGAPDPVAEWRNLRKPVKSPILFNYERGLY